MTTDRIVLGIHGLANKPEQKVLADDWQKAIKEGLARNHSNQTNVPFDLSYWAGIRYENPLQENDEPYVAAEGTGPLRRYKSGLVEKLRAVSQKWGGRILDKEKDLIGLGTNVEKVLDVTLKDLAAYYDDSTTRQKIRDCVRETIEAHRDNKLFIIAHSMGSIVTYDVLRTYRKDEIDVPFLITIGSPLGLPLVSKKIRDEFGDNTTPAVAKVWKNIADPGDKVALDVALADEYDPNGQGVKVEDVLVHNDYVSPTGDDNSHKSYGYLRAPELSELIHRFVS